MVLELDADLPLGGLVPDEGVLQELLRGRAAGVGLHQAALNEVHELLGPAGRDLGGSSRRDCVRT